MARVEPFETAPHLAIAVSGGSDSLALALLAQDWVRSRGGMITALTVDHGLRRGSAAEAAHVGEILARFGIAHVVLSWQGDKPASRIQERARIARYRLLFSWCKASGVLHLLLGHQRQDQAETVMMRIRHGSRWLGLAAMARIAEMPDCRLLRPLLAIDRTTLRAWLNERGVAWVDDPSNRDSRHERARVRAELPAMARDGISHESLTSLALQAARARSIVEAEAADMLAEGLRLDPAGFARLGRKILSSAAKRAAVCGLSRVLTTVGGRVYEPDAEAVEKLVGTLTIGGDKRQRTLHRCLVGVIDDDIVISREVRGLPSPMRLPWPASSSDDTAPIASVDWDGRFRIRFPRLLVSENERQDGCDDVSSLMLLPMAATDKEVWETLRNANLVSNLPRQVLPTLPAFVDDHGVVSVPHVGFMRAEPPVLRISLPILQFRPRVPCSGSGYMLA